MSLIRVVVVVVVTDFLLGVLSVKGRLTGGCFMILGIG